MSFVNAFNFDQSNILSFDTELICKRFSFFFFKVKNFRFGVKLGCFRIPFLDEDFDMSKLLQYVNTSIEDTETGEVHDVSLSDLPNLYRQLQIEAEERNDLEAETENDESDSLKFLPEENELEAVAENDESDSLVFLPEEENNESD